MNTTEALIYFDGLEPVSAEFMMGQWHGSSFNHAFSSLRGIDQPAY
jgi:hypothetical protein